MVGPKFLPRKGLFLLEKNKKTKFIFVSGGVISGIGKGITTSSIAAILQAKGYKVSPMKIDMYLNVDAGTIRPQEHGEVFVTDDGTETDQDLGNYERFLGVDLSKVNYCTTGQVYQEVIRKERAFEYDGEDVEAIPHVSDEIIKRIEEAGKSLKADIVIIELGGTVGEYQNGLFFEASRIMRLRNPQDVIQVHVAYLPVPGNLGEMKSKPVQQSVRVLNSMGIQPDIVIGRSEGEVDQRRKERLALFTNVQMEDVISNPNVESIYEVPLVLSDQNVGERILEKLGLKSGSKDLKKWRDLVDRIKTVNKEVKIGVVGKYFATGDFQLEDVYISVIEALKHAAWGQSLKPRLFWFDSINFEKTDKNLEALKDMDGLVIPGGFGSRGTEGLISAIQFARENRIPCLGLCYGLHMAVIEFARNVLNIKEAQTTEIDDDTPHPVIHIMPDQEKKLLVRDYGASMRLGSWEARVKKGTKTYEAYGQETISERHRHRYEVNNKYKDALEKSGFIVSATSPDGHLVEIMELKDHPFLVGSQFHPELKSRPFSPHPLFTAFIKKSRKAS
jgi:CTP synthase